MNPYDEHNYAMRTPLEAGQNWTRGMERVEVTRTTSIQVVPQNAGALSKITKINECFEIFNGFEASSSRM